jgi:hypothetical protein
MSLPRSNEFQFHFLVIYLSPYLLSSRFAVPTLRSIFQVTDFTPSPVFLIYRVNDSLHCTMVDSLPAPLSAVQPTVSDVSCFLQPLVYFSRTYVARGDSCILGLLAFCGIGGCPARSCVTTREIAWGKSL